jgi:anthranilate synthase/aminodeoxychorismate synthase-like glutamine amidotransferase
LAGVILIDNFDSFSYMLRDYVLQLGIECLLFTNDLNPDQVLQTPHDALLLSPGPKRPEHAGFLMEYVARSVGKVPILGICLGHQAIGMHFGWELVRAARPMHGKTSRLQILKTKPFFDNVLENNVEVMRYHSLILKPPAEHSALEICALSPENEIMAIHHPGLRCSGLQFHPESALSPGGLNMLRNWFNHYQLL